MYLKELVNFDNNWFNYLKKYIFFFCAFEDTRFLLDSNKMNICVASGLCMYTVESENRICFNSK